MAALAAAITQSERRITRLRSQFRRQWLGERVEVEAEISCLSQEATKAGFRSQLLEVRAPVAETVQGLATTSLGIVVHAGATQLRVVPKSGVLRAEVTFANADIGFVQVGKRAKAKLVAYKSVIGLDTQHLTLPGSERLKLAPSRDATMETHQGRRIVKGYLLSPGRRVGAKAARER
jgi:hemolysin D